MHRCMLYVRMSVYSLACFSFQFFCGPPHTPPCRKIGCAPGVKQINERNSETKQNTNDTRSTYVLADVEQMTAARTKYY